MGLFRSFVLAGLLLAFAGCSNQEKVIPAPVIHLNTESGVVEMEVNDTLVLDPKIVYDYNSKYKWVEKGEVIATTKKLILRPLKNEIRKLTFEVENPQGTDKKDVEINVIILSDFENFLLKDNSVIYNSGDKGYFSDRIMKYPNKANVNARNWDGFAISNKFAVSTNDSASIFHVNTSAGSAKAKEFGIYHFRHGIDNRITFTDGKSHTLKSIDICNNLFTAQTVKFGFAKKGIAKFEKGDWLSVQITAYNASGAVTGTKEEILADYRFENPAKYIILSAWKTVDLSGINDVTSIDLIVKSSRGDIPTYICFNRLKLYN